MRRGQGCRKSPLWKKPVWSLIKLRSHARSYQVRHEVSQTAQVWGTRESWESECFSPSKCNAISFLEVFEFMKGDLKIPRQHINAFTATTQFSINRVSRAIASVEFAYHSFPSVNFLLSQYFWDLSSLVCKKSLTENVIYAYNEINDLTYFCFPPVPFMPLIQHPPSNLAFSFL